MLVWLKNHIEVFSSALSNKYTGLQGFARKLYPQMLENGAKEKRKKKASLSNSTLLIIFLLLSQTAMSNAIHKSVLRCWKKELEDHGEKAFPGTVELRQLQRENQRLKETVEILEPMLHS